MRAMERFWDSQFERAQQVLGRDVGISGLVCAHYEVGGCAPLGARAAHAIEQLNDTPGLGLMVG